MDLASIPGVVEGIHQDDSMGRTLEPTPFDSFRILVTEPVEFLGGTVVAATSDSAPDVLGLVDDGGGAHTLFLSHAIPVGEWTRITLNVQSKQTGAEATVDMYVIDLLGHDIRSGFVGAEDEDINAKVTASVNAVVTASVRAMVAAITDFAQATSSGGSPMWRVSRLGFGRLGMIDLLGPSGAVDWDCYELCMQECKKYAPESPEGLRECFGICVNACRKSGIGGLDTKPTYETP